VKVTDKVTKAIRSTRILTPDGFAPATVLLEGERIAAVRAWDDVPAGARLTDFGDLTILPGLVDTHVHINDPGSAERDPGSEERDPGSELREPVRMEWEGFETATRAAAAGGVTTLVDMPLNCLPETVNVEALEAKRGAARGKAWVDWAAWGGVVPGNAEALEPLVAAGVPGFKCFLIDSGIAGFKWVNETDLREALGKLHGIELPLLAHAEVAGPVETATRELNAAAADWRKYATYLASRPDAAETEAIAMLIRLAGEFGAPVHIVHLASAEALPMLTEARRQGLPITVETCVHYLWFAAEEIANGATEYKCAPPIRSVANREALWNALERGLIDMVTTDHSPCPPEMKCRDEGRFDKAWGGIASLGLALPVMWTAMKRRGIALEYVGEWMAEAPARLADLDGQKGVIDAGADADFAVFDPDAEWTVTESDLSFRHKISPYLGAKLFGRVHETWLRGELVYRAGGFVGEARGREQARL
jgi:allantoinase